MASESDEPTRYSIHVNEGAISDIDAIYGFLAENADIFVAEKQEKLIFDRIRKLDIFPNGHPIYDLFPEMRVAHAGKYRILFWVDNDEHEVVITHIFHARQDIGLAGHEVLVVDSVGVSPMTRSQAKKLLAGLERYKKIIFNFAGIEVIGQAFADEIFRVFNIHHPDIILEPINMSESVNLMVTHAQNDPTGRE